MTRDEADQKTRKQIEEADELGLYFMINEIGGFVWRMNHDMADGRIPEKDWPMIDEEIARLRPLQTFAVSQLTRIGVETPLKEDGKSPTDEYWAWFRWWDGYIKGLPEDQWKELESAYPNGDYSKFRPEGEWK